MKRSIIISLILILLAYVPSAVAQTTTVTIRLRDTSGAPIPLEEVRLVALPENNEHTAVTGINGRVTFNVFRGLYEIHLRAALDNISTLAVAEGGLESFGITVGDESIEYSFVYHSDNRFYFDATPEQEMAQPIIPSEEDLHFIFEESTPTTTPLTFEFVTMPFDTDPINEVSMPEETQPKRPWFFFAGLLGLLLTNALWNRYQKKAETERKSTLAIGGEHDPRI